MKWIDDSTTDTVNAKRMYLALSVTVAGNLLLALTKWSAAVRSGSSAVYADAYNSISDVLYSLTLVIGLLISIRPADRSHPHGHERFEPLVGLVISFSMGFAAYAALSEAIDKLRNGAAAVSPSAAIPALILSAAVKCLMFLIIRAIAKKTHSTALKDAAADNLSDMLTSAAAVLGILLSNAVAPICDPLIGILLSLWIFKAAFSALFENLNYLTGHGVDDAELQSLQHEIENVPGVLGVHKLVAEYVGTKLRLDIHIDMDGSMPLRQLHDIETEIENRMASRQEIDHIFIHAEPLGADQSSKNESSSNQSGTSSDNSSSSEGSDSSGTR